MFKEKISGRKKFNLLIERVQEGDFIVITTLDRFARSTKYY
ncbi:recombinase family protein [Bacillus mobilis]|nr:recombinase family protein [Bacillus mobilis]